MRVLQNFRTHFTNVIKSSLGACYSVHILSFQQRPHVAVSRDARPAPPAPQAAVARSATAAPFTRFCVSNAGSSRHCRHCRRRRLPARLRGASAGTQRPPQRPTAVHAAAVWRGRAAAQTPPFRRLSTALRRPSANCMFFLFSCWLSASSRGWRLFHQERDVSPWCESRRLRPLPEWQRGRQYITQNYSAVTPLGRRCGASD